ncbi:MAG: protein tyrosine phosphatase family protein [Anaerolineales bacterium]|nr:protein tyrosine phosphatase family protein [Anaerolineales bacterium]
MHSTPNNPATLLENIYHFRRLSEQLATAGQPTAEQFSWIAQAGFEVVINLALASGERTLADEPGIVHALGMAYIHIPVVWESPQLADLDLFIKTMDQQAGQNVFLHCTANLRVSAFMALYQLAKQELSADQARTEAQHFWQFNPTWETFFEEAICSLASLA